MMPLLPSNARLWHIADSCHEAAKQPLAKQHLLAAFVDQEPRIAIARHFLFRPVCRVAFLSASHFSRRAATIMLSSRFDDSLDSTAALPQVVQRFGTKSICWLPYSPRARSVASCCASKRSVVGASGESGGMQPHPGKKAWGNRTAYWGIVYANDPIIE